MDLEKIEGLVKIIEDSSLNEFTYKDKDVKITMSKLDHPDRKSTRLNSSHIEESRMPSSA